MVIDGNRIFPSHKICVYKKFSRPFVYGNDLRQKSQTSAVCDLCASSFAEAQLRKGIQQLPRLARLLPVLQIT